MTALQRIYEKAALCRAFELECQRRLSDGEIKIPVYLSLGQEYVPATVATWCEVYRYLTPQIFVQHRAHSVFLAFGHQPKELVRQIRFGMEGSNCIQAPNIYGHDALLGTQVPIAVGACYGNRRPTICFLGDAAVEEDYALAAFGWAATQCLPILFVVEDNNLSILTEKRVRRSWDAAAVASAFGLSSRCVSDDPDLLFPALTALRWPALINVSTTRLCWHSGAGTDGPAFDRHAEVKKNLPWNVAGWAHDADLAIAQRVREAWQ